MAGGLYKDGKKIAEITEISISGPSEAQVNDCPKSSCQRHGACMYLNHPRCPFNRLNMATDLRKD